MSSKCDDEPKFRVGDIVRRKWEAELWKVARRGRHHGKNRYDLLKVKSRPEALSGYSVGYDETLELSCLAGKLFDRREDKLQDTRCQECPLQLVCIADMMQHAKR